MNKEMPLITFDQLYRDFTLKALNRAGNVPGAAKLLGVSERTVFRWKKIYGIQKDYVNHQHYVIESQN